MLQPGKAGGPVPALVRERAYSPYTRKQVPAELIRGMFYMVSGMEASIL